MAFSLVQWIKGVINCHYESQDVPPRDASLGVHDDESPKRRASFSSGVYICKSIVDDLREGNYICKLLVVYLTYEHPIEIPVEFTYVIK